MIRQVLTAAALFVLGTAAQASDYRTPSVVVVPAPGPVVTYSPVTAGCASPKMLSDIGRRFNWSQGSTWGSRVRIKSVANIEETGLVPIGRGLVERRYCQGFAMLNTGEQSPLYYMIESEQGLFGLGSRVEFCVEAYDTWRTHDGYCRTVRQVMR